MSAINVLEPWRAIVRLVRHCVPALPIVLLSILWGSPLSAAEDSSADGLSTQKIVLKLNSEITAYHVGFFSAIQQGYFEEEGFEVSIVPGRDDFAVHDALADGRADFGVSDTSVIQAVAAGKALVVVAPIVQTSRHTLLMHQDSNIREILDLAGARIAVSDRNSALAEVLFMFREYDVPLESVHIDHGQYSFADVENKSYDAISEEVHRCPLPSNPYPAWIIKPSAKVDHLFYGTLLITSRRMAEEDLPTITRFRRAALRGWHYALANKEDAIAAVRAYPGFDRRDDVYAERDYRMLQTHIRQQSVFLGHLERERWQKNVEAYKTLGLIPQDMDSDSLLLDEYLDNSSDWVWWVSVAAAILIASAGVFFIWNSSLRRLATQRRKELRSAAENIAQEAQEKESALGDLRKSRNTLRAFLDNLPAAAFVKDTKGVYLAANRTFCSHIERDEGQVVGRSSHELFPEDEAQNGMDDDRQVILSRLPVRRVRDIIIYGRARKLSIVKFPVIDSAGSVMGIGGIAEDITEKLALEEHKLNSQKMEAISGLAGGVAHDFNNILSVVLSYSQRIKANKGDQAENMKSAQNVINAAERAKGLTRQLMGISRREVSRPEATELNQLVRNEIDLLSRILGDEIELYTELCEEELPIFADPVQVEQILLNLLVNARDASSAGDAVELKTFRESGADSDPDDPRAWAVLRVEDHGYGMDEETLARISEPFFTTKPDGQGTGLGMATVYSIVERCEGSVDVSSTVGEGTTFSVRFPILEEERSKKNTDRIGVRRQPINARVLVVGEDQGERDILRATLGSRGATISEANSAEEALELVESGDSSFDVLVTNLSLSGVGRPELVRGVKRSSPTVSVIYMSDHQEDQMPELDSVEYPDGFIAKPLKDAEVIAEVRRVLREKE